MVEREIVQLHLDMRPQTLDDVRHQEAVVGRIKSELKTGTFPHATMFTGSSGVGKTTVARILRDELGCDAFDYVEANMADKRGIDEIRSFASSVGMAPMGKCRVYVLDECHQITKTGQQALLKVLEDCPKHAYFILLTSEPTKLIPAVKTRCSVYKFLAMNRKQSVGFVMQAACTIGKLTDNDPPKSVSGSTSWRRPSQSIARVHNGWLWSCYNPRWLVRHPPKVWRPWSPPVVMKKQ